MSVMKVEDILKRKGRMVTRVAPSDTVAALCKLLSERKVGAAVVSADGTSIDGVITERDITYGLARHRSAIADLLVEDLMTRAVITCKPADDVALVASTMLSRNIRHVPVVDGKGPAGMISIRDVLAMRLDELQQQTAQLHAFISDTTMEPVDRE